VRIRRCVYLQEHSGRPEQLDASVMANPDFVNTDLRNDHKYNIMVAAEPAQSQACPVLHPHVRHPYPFSTMAGQLPATGFPVPANVDYHLPTVTAAASVYSGRFNPSPFNQQFPSEVLNERNGLPAANSYQTNVDAIRPVGAPFDNFSNLFGVMPPLSTGNSPNFHTSCQPLSYPSPSSGFMSPADSTGFGNPLQSSAGRSSSRPWPPPPPDLHRPAFGQLSRFHLMANESSVGDFCGALPQNSAVGSDSLSSGSPITELLDRGNSPGARYGCAVTLPSQSMSDMMESVHGTVASSPFCPSPIDGLHLSRSLPAGVRFGNLSSVDGAAAVGHYPASRMHFDSMSAASPTSRQSFFQPASVHDDRTAAGGGYQVQLIAVCSVRNCYSRQNGIQTTCLLQHFGTCEPR